MKHPHNRSQGRILIACVALLLAAAAGCGNDNNAEGETTFDRIQRTGTIRIAYANEEPYGFLDTASGDVTGEAPEIARVIADRLDIEHVEPILTEWKSLIPGLKAGRFDVIAAGMYITPERAENVIFSDPTYRIGEAFMVQAGNPVDLRSFSDVAQNPQARLGLVRGTVERDYAERAGVPENQVVIYPDNNSAVAGLQAGQIDAFAATALTVQTLLSKFGSESGLERADPFEQPRFDGNPVYGYGAFAFRPEDTELRAAFNTELNGFLGTPEHATLVEPFGFTEADLTNGITADQVIAGQTAP